MSPNSVVAALWGQGHVAVGSVTGWAYILDP